MNWKRTVFSTLHNANNTKTSTGTNQKVSLQSKSFGWEKSLSGEKTFGGEKSMGRNLSNGEKPFDWSQFLCYWHYEECWTQFSCNNCIHPFKPFMLSTKVKEDATKNHKFHIPFSWINFHHIDKSENEDATKTHKVHIPFSWIKFHHIDKSENEDATKNRKFNIAFTFTLSS